MFGDIFKKSFDFPNMINTSILWIVEIGEDNWLIILLILEGNFFILLSNPPTLIPYCFNQLEISIAKDLLRVSVFSV